MHESGADKELIGWTTPQCPFRIEYVPRVMDDIRLAVVDAFFSLPRGGAEIGGVLLGKHEPGRLLILDYAPLDCEHASGPSFTLSARDEEVLRKMLAAVRSEFPGLHAVGWYHSHTRSEIYLSEADLTIHRKYFSEPWHVALVLKPHAFHPTRAGFFFRETSGHIHASGPYNEIVIEALPMHPAAAGPIEIPALDAQPSSIRLERNPSIAQPEQDDEPAAEPYVPQFLTAPAEPSRRWRVILLIGVLAAAGSVGYLNKDRWVQRLAAALHPQPPVPAAPPSLGLKAIDQDGQLQITWDRNGGTVSHAVEAVLEISDGGPLPQAITLDQAHLQNGRFTYARQTERVDVKLILHQAEGRQVSDVTTFLGTRPPVHTADPDPEVRKERDRLAEEAAKLKSTVDSQTARTRKLEKDLKTLREEMKNQQQRRLINQLPEGK